MTSEDFISQTVAAGAQLLDEKIPDWYQRIDLDTLNMADPCNCICGQLSDDGDWTPVVDFLSGINSETYIDSDMKAWTRFVSEHGFFSSTHDSWVVAIKTRRALAATPTMAVS